MAKVEDFCDLSNELRREAFNDPAVGADLGSLRVDLLAVFGPPEPVGEFEKWFHIHRDKLWSPRVVQC